MNTLLYKKLWQLKNRLVNPKVFYEINKINKSQFSNKEDIKLLQLKRLKLIVRYAYQNTDFYKNKYDKEKFSPDDIDSISVLKQIPILSKEEIRLNLNKMIPANIIPGRLKKMYTGGSTGKPLMIYHDKYASNTMIALHFRMLNQWGIPTPAFGERTVHVWGASYTNENQIYNKQTLWNRFKTNYVWFNAFAMSEKSMDKWAKFWDNYKPKIVIGYTSALTEFASYLIKTNNKSIRPKIIWTTSEPLYDFQKLTLENAFKADVFSQYGLNEIHHIASDCKHQKGLHINAENRIVEISSNNNKSKKNEPGNIIVTDLSNYAMPLIRYDTEDISKILSENCSCGINLPMIDYVSGRVCDIIKLKNGRRIHSEWFTHQFKVYNKEIRRFQVHQVSIDKSIVSIIPEKGININSLIAKLNNSFKLYTDNLMTFEMRIVNNIDKETSGKFRFIKSNVDINV